MKNSQKIKISNKKPNKMKIILSKINDFIDKILFPYDIKCIFCGKDIADFYNKPYCEECEKNLPVNNGNRCLICDQPIFNEATVCDFCQNSSRNFKRAFVPFIYKDAVRNAILAYKESNKRYLAKAFARLIVQRLEKEKVEISYVCYVPLTKKKEKQRSFNQAKLLAIEIAKLLDVQIVDALEKVKENPAQKTLSFKDRQKNMIGSFVLKNTKFEKDKNLLLVDDVITTCATVNYCAGLLCPKVKNVYVCAIARNVLKEN